MESLIEKIKPLQEEFNKFHEKLLTTVNMTKPFKKLLGNRVYLNIPAIPESSLILSEEVKKSIILAEQNKYKRLTVYAVGDLVTLIQEGDEIFVDPSALTTAPVVDLTDKLSVIMISPFSIIHVW